MGNARAIREGGHSADRRVGFAVRVVSRLLVAALAVQTVLAATACGKPEDTRSSAAAPSTTTTAPGPRTIEQLCNSLTWHRELRDVAGLPFHDLR